MPRTKGELPSDLTPDELNNMICDLAYEMGCPPAGTVYPPDLVELGPIPPEIFGYNGGCSPSGVEMYAAGQKWRHKLIAELKERPDWIALWRAGRELDRRVRELCEAKSLRFAPYECPPWWIRADEELPPQNGTDSIWAESAKLAQRLRRQLEAELAEEDETPA
jgi:hypothetical protein